MDLLAYLLTRAWLWVALIAGPGIILVLICIAEEAHIAAIVIAVVALGLTALVIWRERVHEAASRKVAWATAWQYSTWGPTVDDYRVWAPPFTTIGNPRTVRRSTRVMVLDGRTAVVERMYVPRDPFYWSGDEYVQLVHLGNAFSTVRLTRNTVRTRELAQPVSVSTELADFNAQWSVVAQDPAFAHAWLTPQVQECLMSLGSLVPRVTLSGAGLYAHGHREDPAHFVEIAVLLGRIAVAMPSGVVQKYGSALDPMRTIPRTEVERALVAMDGPRRVAPAAGGGRSPYLAVAAAVCAIPIPILGAILALAAIGAPDSGRRWARILAWIALAVSFASILAGVVNVFVNG